VKHINQNHLFSAIFTLFILILFSCTKQAPTVNPGDYTQGNPPNYPGYYYPFVSAVYPSNSSTSIPLDTKYIIVFNLPIDTSTLAGNITATRTPLPSPPGVPVAQAFSISSANNPIIELTFTGTLAANNRISVTLNNGILDQGGTIPLNNPGTWTFDTGTAPDTIQPTISAGTNVPTSPPLVSLTAPGIQISFSEAINPSTINNTNFYLQRVDPGPTYVLISTVCGWSPTAAPTTATLTPGEALDPSSQYRVTVTTGMTDMSGNALSAGTTWTFTTVNGDPVFGAPYIVNSVGTLDLSAVYITYISTNSASIEWATNEATNYTINYGLGNNTGTSLPFLTDYSSTHSYLLTPPLSPGKRYWVDIDYNDYIGTPGTVSSTIEFNTETSEDPLAVAPRTLYSIDTSSENQTGLNWISRKADVANTGAFMSWRNFTSGSPGYYSIYGQRYDNSLTPSATWNTGNPVQIFTEANQTYTYSSMIEDGLGGMIVTVLRGNEVRTKRLSSAAGAIVDWGGGTTGASTGLRIDAAGTNTYASTVPVYSGFITSIANGTTEMASMSLPNPFFDDSVDLSGLTNGYIIMDPNNHDGTTINNVGQDFNYMLGQNANVITSVLPDTYYIGDNVTNTITFTAENHTMNVFGNRNNGGNSVYSEHGITLAALTALNIGVGDIIQNGTNYGYITAVTEFAMTAIDSGTANANRANHLIDGSADFNAATAVMANDVARNTSTGLYANISAVTTTDLTLSSDNFPNGNEGYEIYEMVSMGTATGIAGNLLQNTTGTFFSDGVVATDIVVNLSNGSWTTVATTPTLDTELDLSAQIFTGTENYRVVRNLLRSGTANANRTSHLIDGTKNWLATVSVGDLVVRTSGVGAPQYTTVAVGGVTANDLTLSADIFPNGNESYEIYHEFCTTHTTTPVDTFMRLTINWAIGVTNGGSVSLYNTVATGTADTQPANPIYDNEGVAQGIPSVNVNDIAINYSTFSVGTVNTVGTPHFNHALGTNVVNMFNDNEEYRIIRFNNLSLNAGNIVTTGIADASAASHLQDAGNTFASVNTGDIAYNVTDNQYAMVINRVANDLTLSRDATFSNNDRYIIVRCAGVLYVWYNGTNIQASIRSMADGTVLRAEYTLVAGATNPYTMSDGKGNAYVIYRTGAGQLMVSLINAAGNAVWTSDVDTQGLVTENILKVISDDSDGFIILYYYGDATSTMHVQRIRDNSGAIQRPWGVSGYSALNTAARDAGSVVDMVGDATNGVIVAAQIGNNIWANRVTAAGATPWVLANRDISTATGNQQNPKIFTDWTNARIVWEDDRFTSTTGYGIFGMQFTAGGGAKSAAWSVNTFTPDNNGASVVLNSGNKYSPLGIQIVTYNNGLNGALIWEDWRNINATLPYEGSDLLYIDIQAFTPY
jgi:hypothetical protein